MVQAATVAAGAWDRNQPGGILFWLTSGGAAVGLIPARCGIQHGDVGRAGS